MNVFWNVPLGTGLSLAALTQHNFSPTQSPPESVLRNRTKIGQGIKFNWLLGINGISPICFKLKLKSFIIFKGLALSREEDGVWAYNLSDWPMFVNSPTLDDPDSKSYLVFRVPSGYCLNIFTGNPYGDRIRYSNGVRVGPVDPNAVRISFAKGWGPKYSRQEITSCPTWIEVLLDPCRWHRVTTNRIWDEMCFSCSQIKTLVLKTIFIEFVTQTKLCLKFVFRVFVFWFCLQLLFLFQDL